MGGTIGVIALCICGFVGVVAAGSTAIALLLVPGALLAWALGLPIVFTLPFTFVAIALIVVWQRFAPSKAQRAETTREMLTARLCPACGHSLAGLDADDAGGPVTCPECGGAWTIPEPITVGCGVCDASMEGQTVDRFGRLRCPVCGEVHVTRSVAMEQMD